MPIKIISPAGGNFNASTTWVGGIVPVQDDVIVGDATSGNLIWTTTLNGRYVLDMTNYAATMSINTLSWNMPSNTTVSPIYTISTFSSNMTIAYSSVNNMCITTNGTTTRRFAFLGSGPFGEFPLVSVSGTVQALIINGTMKMDTLQRTNTQTAIEKDAINGGTMSIRKYDGSFTTGGNLMTGGCAIVFDRETGEWQNTNNALGGFVGHPITIKTTATFSITPNTGQPYGFLGLRAGGSLNHISGNISSSNKNLWISNQLSSSSTITAQTTVLGLSSSGTWSTVNISDTAVGSYNATTLNTYNLSSDLLFNELRIQPNNGSGQYIGGTNTFRIITRFSGAGRLKGGYLVGQVFSNSSYSSNPNIPNYNGTQWFVPRVQLASGLPTNDFTGIRMFSPPNPTGLTGGEGLSASFCQISSTASGTTAYIKANEATSFGVWFQDIDASAGIQIQNYFGSLNNTVNIVNTNSLPSGSGGAGGSFTFVN